MADETKPETPAPAPAAAAHAPKRAAPRPAPAPLPDLAGKTTSAASPGGAAAAKPAPAAAKASTRDADDASPLLNRRAWMALAWGAFSAASAAALAVYRAHADRMELVTGRAEWIWYSSRVPKPVPLHFYAVREVALASAPSRAVASVFVDREHVLFVNGQRAGGGTQRPGDPLATYEVAPLLRTGVNRFVIEASSPTGIGGILFVLDLGRQTLVSDDGWRVYRDAAALTRRQVAAHFVVLRRRQQLGALEVAEVPWHLLVVGAPRSEDAALGEVDERGGRARNRVSSQALRNQSVLFEAHWV